MRRFVYINGRIVAEKDAVVPVYDRGLNYGDGLFETIKAYDGRPAFLREHMERLSGGLQLMRIPQKLLKGFASDIRDGAIGEVLKRNSLDRGEAYVKVIITRGADSSGHAPPRDIRPNIIIISKPLDTRAISSYQKKGVKAVLIRGYSPALPGLKTLNYLPNIMARAEARWRGVFEGIFTAGDSSVLEGSSTNIFVVKGGAIKTPPVGKGLSTGVLPGVTRGAVIRISKEMGLSVKEAKTAVRDIYGCDEAFLTNSILEVVPLIGVEGRKIGGGRPGPVTKRLQLAYGRSARENLS